MKATRSRTKHDGITRLDWPSGRTTYEARAPWWIDAAGKRHSPMKNFDRLADALSWRREQLGERERGIRRPTGRETFGEYVDGWLARYATRNPGNTAAAYGRAIAKLRPLEIWQARLADLDSDDVAHAYDSIDAKALPYVHDALHLALGDAVPKRIGRNPASGAMRGRRIERDERPVWTEDEYRAWLDAAAQDELWPLWRLLGQTGARRGELLGLDWPDVDLDAGTVMIRRQYTVVAGRHTLKDVKTKQGRRTIELDEETVAVLRDWRKRQPTRRLGRDAHAVFTFADGSRVGPSRALQDRFEAITKAAGVRRLTIHDVRHTHATALLRRGVPIHVVSRRLGHASPAITLQVYSHVLPDQGRLAADVAGLVAAAPPAAAAQRPGE